MRMKIDEWDGLIKYQPRVWFRLSKGGIGGDAMIQSPLGAIITSRFHVVRRYGTMPRGSQTTLASKAGNRKVSTRHLKLG